MKQMDLFFVFCAGGLGETAGGRWRVCLGVCQPRERLGDSDVRGQNTRHLTSLIRFVLVTSP